MAGNRRQPPSIHQIDHQIVATLRDFPQISLAILFGSVAAGRENAQSDCDIAVAASQPLSVEEKMALIGSLAEQLGRPVDLVDLTLVSEPLLGQILRHGRRLVGSDRQYAELIRRHLFDQADFMPYRTRILEERRRAWIEK